MEFYLAEGQAMTVERKAFEAKGHLASDTNGVVAWGDEFDITQDQMVHGVASQRTDTDFAAPLGGKVIACHRGDYALHDTVVEQSYSDVDQHEERQQEAEEYFFYKFEQDNSYRMRIDEY